jgi:hypothetical protein
VTWFNHLQYTGGTSFQKNLGNLQRVAGVAANIGHGGDGGEGILDDVQAYVQVYDFGRTGPEARARLESEVRSPILASVDAGARGAFLVSHHIASPGLIMIEKFLDAFRVDLSQRGCDLAVVALVRHPVAHRVSQFLKFRDDVGFDAGLAAVRDAAPAFPLADNAVPFEQLREFLFMDQARDADNFAAIRAQIADPESVAGGAAAAAAEAAEFVANVAATAERRRAEGKPHATFEGVLRHAVDDLADADALVGGGDLPARFEAAKTTLVSATQNLINKFDVVLAATEDQEEALLRMAEKMDWHPDLLRESGPENAALAQVRADVREVLNNHRGSLDVDVPSLPRDAQRAVWRWTELDAALYLVANSQRRARTVATLALSEADLRAAASAEADPGTRWVRATTGCADEKDSALVDAAELLKLGFEREGGVGNLLKEMLQRLNAADGCFRTVVEEERAKPAFEPDATLVALEEGGEDDDENAAAEANAEANPANPETRQVETVATAPPVEAEAAVPANPGSSSDSASDSASDSDVLSEMMALPSPEADASADADADVGPDGFPDASDLPILEYDVPDDAKTNVGVL